MDPNVDSVPPAHSPAPPHAVPSASPPSAQGPTRLYRINPNTFHLRCFNIPTTPLNMFERGRVHLRYYGLLRASVFAGCDCSAEEDEVFSLKEGGKEVWYIQRSVGELICVLALFRRFTIENQDFVFMPSIFFAPGSSFSLPSGILSRSLTLELATNMLETLALDSRCSAIRISTTSMASSLPAPFSVIVPILSTHPTPRRTTL